MTMTHAPSVVRIVSPFQRYALLWQWMQDDPDLNCDDSTPTTEEAFVQMMTERQQVERTWGVLDSSGAECGAVGYCPIDARRGMLHGICFARRVHGSGIPRQAVSMIFEQLFDEGVQKISAAYFVSNERVRRFLARFGFDQEGLLRRATWQHGQPVDMRLVALFPDTFRKVG